MAVRFCLNLMSSSFGCGFQKSVDIASIALNIFALICQLKVVV